MGGGGGARVSELLYLESKCEIIFSWGGGGNGVSDIFYFFFWGGGGRGWGGWG